MELQQIKYFLALAQELHFWNTAEKMYITQSALSRQIKALEDELGIRLFERNNRSVKLTEAGVFLRDQWLPLLDEIDRVHRQAKKIHEGTYGSLSIGYPGSISYGFLPTLIDSVAHTFPDLRIELVEPVDNSLEQLLLNYQMDLALRRDPPTTLALQSVCLYTEHFSLVVPSHHSVQAQNFTGLQQVAHEKFILSGLHHNTEYVNSLRKIFNDYGFSPIVHIESDFGAMILNLVARGVGISILPSSYAVSAHPDVRFIRLPYTVNLYATWRKDDTSPVLHNVLKQVQQVAARFATA